MIDFQKAFTDSHADGDVANTAKLLKSRGRRTFPSCYTAYKSVRDMAHWKVGMVREQFIHGHPCTGVDPRPRGLRWPCARVIFFQTPVVPYFVKERVDTVIVTGCITSRCIRASTVSSRRSAP